MMLKSSKKIKLKNLKDGDIINYSLLLIRGLVNPIDNCANLIQLHVNSNNIIQTFSESICATTGEFKFILDLKNCHWCDTKTTLVALHFKYSNEELCLQIVLDAHQSPYRLQPFYILCRDEEETDLAKLHCKIINLNFRLIQALYADRIQKSGLPRATFTLNGGCCIYRADISLAEALSSDEQTLWHRVAEEFLRKNQFNIGGDRKLKLVAFIGCTKYDGDAVVASGDFSYVNIKKHLRAHAALGGGDLALFGSAFFYAWAQELQQIVPCFLNQKPVNPAIEADESNYRRTFGGVYASTLGAVCHEIGHIFDLGHDDGIMGTGLDFVNRVLTINNRTENLPKRTFGNTPSISNIQTSTRVTKFVKRNQSFLENYRKQKENDGFYFTRNCALILAHHRWFCKGQTKESAGKCDTNNLISFNCGLVQSSLKALKIVEIRSNTDSQVVCFFEIEDSNTFEYQISSDTIIQYQLTHHLFVMSIDGVSKRFELN